MSNITFNHLHVHTEYSALDGLCKIEELILRAKELGQTAMAITDHGVSSGLYEAYVLGKKHNFNMLLGEEFYFQNEDNKNGHIILIAKNNEGLKNIYRLQAEAIDNFYYKPRITLEMLNKYHEGLVCTTACIANQVGQYILQDKVIEAEGHIIRLKKIFGDDFYLELQSSTIDDVIKVNKKLKEIITESGYKYIITNDVHYVYKEDYDVHEVMLCIQQKSKMDSDKRWKFEANDYWLKSEQEMREYIKYLGDDFINKGFEYICEVIEKCCEVTIESGNYLPKWTDSSGLNEDDALEKMSFEKYFDRIVPRQEGNIDFVRDIQKELEVVKQTGYSGYFMIVQEYANWARENGLLVGDGRGSGAGSKLAYALGITEVNPQKYDLLFERFLSPGREPDFDIDFSDIDAVYKHLQNLYGDKNVARVGAFNRLTCKSALRKVMGVYGFPQSKISQIVALLPNELTFTLDEAIEYSSQFKKWLESNENIYRCVRKLEGKMSHYSTHAGGVIICENLTSILPVMKDKDDDTKLVVGYDKHIIADLGHYKFDILGLKSLNMLQNALNNIEETTGKTIDWTTVNFEDKDVYEMLSSGDVLGVFQLSEQPDKVMEQKPNCFEDLIAINALIRPGVCDWNEYLNARSKNIQSNLSYMNCTHGLIVYQDQYLQLAQTYAGWDIAYSDKHIRKNKDIRNDTELHQKFVNDAINNGYDVDKIEAVWSDIMDVVAGGYGFNRAHSTSYARLSYQTAWLKHYYPKEFYASYVTQNFDDFVELNKVNSILKKLNIKLLNPDINESTDKFIVKEEGILYPITSIKGVGGSILYEINRLKPIKDFDDFYERRIPKFCKKTAIYALIKSGAFDFCGKSRSELLLKSGYSDIIGTEGNMEKETLGIYISASPFEKYPCKKLSEYKEDDFVLIVMQLSNIATVFDKKGNEMAFITGSNDNDTNKIIVFSSTWAKYKDKIKENGIYFIKGRLSKESILANSFELLEGGE